MGADVEEWNTDLGRRVVRALNALERVGGPRRLLRARGGRTLPMLAAPAPVRRTRGEASPPVRWSRGSARRAAPAAADRRGRPAPRPPRRRSRRRPAARRARPSPAHDERMRHGHGSEVTGAHRDGREDVRRGTEMTCCSRRCSGRSSCKRHVAGCSCLLQESQQAGFPGWTVTGQAGILGV